jgi:hypothetical protein
MARISASGPAHGVAGATFPMPEVDPVDFAREKGAAPDVIETIEDSPAASPGPSPMRSTPSVKQAEESPREGT